MVTFYKESKGDKDVAANSFSDFLILDVIRGAIEEGKEGVFAFSVFVAHERSHFILVEKDSFEILDMSDPKDPDRKNEKNPVDIPKEEEYQKYNTVQKKLEDYKNSSQSNGWY